MQRQGSNPCGNVLELVLCQISGKKKINLSAVQTIAVTRELQEKLDGVRDKIEGVLRITMLDKDPAHMERLIA